MRPRVRRRWSHTDAMTLETSARRPSSDTPSFDRRLLCCTARADEVQVGIDSDTALIFSEPKLVPVLLALDGAHHIRDIRDAGAAAGLRRRRGRRSRADPG